MRSPRNLLAEQKYDGHASLHDDRVAQDLGIEAGPVEGPTHFSQFDPLAVHVWGKRWFEQGCISSHFRTMVAEGEEVQASLTPAGPNAARIEAYKPDGSQVLVGSASVGPDHSPSTLEERLAKLGDPGDLFILDRVKLGPVEVRRAEAKIDFESRNTDAYPFSLLEKLAVITEPSCWYKPDGASPWGRPILPTEMISVLAEMLPGPIPVRGPSIGLILDLEVRYLAGPLFVDQPYVCEREVVGLGQSRRTESYWTRSTLIEPKTGQAVARLLLHSGIFKSSYAGYPKDRLTPQEPTTHR